MAAAAAASDPSGHLGAGYRMTSEALSQNVDMRIGQHDSMSRSCQEPNPHPALPSSILTALVTMEQLVERRDQGLHQPEFDHATPVLDRSALKNVSFKRKHGLKKYLASDVKDAALGVSPQTPSLLSEQQAISGAFCSRIALVPKGQQRQHRHPPSPYVARK